MTSLAALQQKYLPALAPEDFFLLLVHATSKEKVFLLAHPEYTLSAAEEERAKEYLERRLRHEPAAYIIGHKEFYGRDFHVTSDTLVPRPETELLIERALQQVADCRQPGNTLETVDIIDVGTGSGNIIITLAKEIEQTHLTGTRYYALDISPQALTTAKKNAQTYDIEQQIDFVESDLLRNFSVPQEKNHRAIIVANLPYLATAIYHDSAPDVRDYEPRSALESGADGLDHYRRLLGELPELLSHYATITIFFEISPEQSILLPRLIANRFPEATINVFPDLAGKDRLIQTII